MSLNTVGPCRGSAYPVRTEPLRERIDWQRTAEVIPLREVTVHFAELLECALVLHPCRYDVEPKLVTWEPR